MVACPNVGWNGTTSRPNPTIAVTQGDVVTLALSSSDSVNHEFQLDVDNDGGESADCGTTDPCSSSFTGTTTFTFTVTANPANYTYFWIFHLSAMKGTFTVKPTLPVGGVAISQPNSITATEIIAFGSLALLAIAGATHFIHSKRRFPAADHI